MDRSAIYQRLADAASKGIEFSTHAKVALKIQKALEDADCSVEQAARLVSGEPLLAARIVAMANSVAYNRSDREIIDIKQAVSLVGFRVVRTLAMAIVVRQLASTPRDPVHRAMAEKLWEHTSNVAALAYVLARRVSRLDAETALFAALVHEVGGFFMLSHAGEYPGLLDGDVADWSAEWQDAGEVLVGRAVLKVLDVPDVVRQGIEAYWLRLLVLPPVSLGDTLILADQLSPVASPLSEESSATQTHAQQIDIETAVGEKMLSEILEESATDVASLAKALHF